MDDFQNSAASPPISRSGKSKNKMQHWQQVREKIKTQAESMERKLRSETMERYIRNHRTTAHAGAPWGEDFYKILKERSKANSGGRHRINTTFSFSENISDSQLSKTEEEFFHACEFGDIPRVRQFLTEDLPDFDLTRSDPLGRTPLRLAAENEHLEIAELLIKKGCTYRDMYDALLLCITLGHQEIAETILKNPTYLYYAKQQNSRDGSQCENTDKNHVAEHAHAPRRVSNVLSDDSQFSMDITPLMLAAQHNRFEIVQLLLMRGERIHRPHHYYCNCCSCKEGAKEDQLRFRIRRLESYRSLASEAYISLASRDPILTAFELAKELREVASMERHFKNEYKELADKLSTYVVRLLDRVRSSAELDLVLNKTGRASKERYSKLARFKLAIIYLEKKFVTHPFCQQKLTGIWYDGVREILEHNNWFYRVLFVVLLILLYPLLAIVYILAPDSRVGKFLKYPIVKMISSTTTYVTFLTMILVFTLTANPANGRRLSHYQPQYDYYLRHKNVSATTKGYPDDFILRSHVPDSLEILIVIWIVGMLWQECKQVYQFGIREYLWSLYNILDSSMIMCYITSFTLRYICYEKTKYAIGYFASEDKWYQLDVGEVEARNQFYWLIADRYLWQKYDAFYISEGLFAIANVLSFSRISALLPANSTVGPTQISLGRMVKSVTKFMFIFLMMFLAFMVGLQNLYWYFNPSVRLEVEIEKRNVTTNAEGGFGTFELTFRTVFWAIFGLGESQVVQLNGYDAVFTESVGYIMYGVYNLTTVVVLLTMLIAVMTKSFEVIQQDADMEWKFARSKLFMEYIEDGTTLPVPFNILPTPKSIKHLVLLFIGQIREKFCRAAVEKEVREACTMPVETTSEAYDMTPRIEPKLRKNFNKFPSLDEVERADSNQGSRQGSIQGEDQAEADADVDAGDVSDVKPRSDLKLTYSKVVRSIVKRYIFETAMEDDKEVTNEELKQDISSFRFEVLNNFKGRKDGDRTPSNNNSVSSSIRALQNSLNKVQDTLHSMAAAKPVSRPKSRLLQRSFAIPELSEEMDDQDGLGDLEDERTIMNKPPFKTRSLSEGDVKVHFVNGTPSTKREVSTQTIVGTTDSSAQLGVTSQSVAVQTEPMGRNAARVSFIQLSDPGEGDQINTSHLSFV
ncbi:short transient receptor potential channel 3 [Lingula anatina]|uniref:Short transient receptor potential channel 3 n=1 Tax=Lingula anatina TaxID=7574 RepID=A0A2R2MJA3_LINAN|nr:short transient receptor potential channel 3 [Lingula anatina]|eukprot:XP_023930274.1 short transient receptor potential channel 3 [Lingula anatina]